jgi:predicted aspartyl protease
MPIVNHPLRAIFGKIIKRPYLDVRYINPHNNKTHKATALIDTGADSCIVPSYFAEILGHDFDKGELKSVLGISGKANCYLHTMKIEIHNYCTDDIQILFSDEIKEPILGVHTFLNNFCLEIHYPNEVFSLRKPQQGENIIDWPKP